MEQRKYDHTTAKAIFEMIGWPESWVIRDDGVFVEDGFRFHSPREQAFDWTPAYDMDWPGAPNPMTAPTLPIEFTARELAASMIDGVGRQIQDALNRRIGYALDDAALQGFGSYHSWVRDALTEAYDVARQAQDVVGELDHDQQQRAYDLLAQYDKAYGQALECEKVMEHEIIGKHKNENPEYGGFIATGDEYLLRLERAKESVAVQKAQAEQAKEQADAALKAWRKAMVRQLLQPHAAPVVADSASSGVEPDKAGPLPLTTNDIANCFSGFREWDVRRWKAELGSPDKWLQACQHRKGIRGKGGYESTWWPVQIAVALANKDQKSARHLRARFKRFEQLSPWLDELEINIPDNSDSQ